MNEQQFWMELQKLIYQSEDFSKINQTQWERLISLHTSPALPTKLIIETVCHGSVYLTEQSALNFPAINPMIPLNASQQLALEMAVSNSAIALIAGSPGTGKTRIAKNLVEAAINCSKRVLLLTHHSTTLNAYCNLPGYPFRISQQQNYRDWLIKELRTQHLAHPKIDYLPLHLLPDEVLTKLRTAAKLEKYLPLIQNNSQQLIELLQQDFPDLGDSRLQLLAYRLQRLKPLLQQQLKLNQLYNNLSENAVAEIADKLIENPQASVVGTVDDFIQIQDPFLWKKSFDLVIVEEAEYLTCFKLILLSTLGNKLVLFGNELPKQFSRISQNQSSRNQSSQNQSFFTRSPECFKWLNQHLLPAYRYQLTEQFRLHPEIANLVYPVICDRWILNQFSQFDCHFPQIRHRLFWQNTRNQRRDEQIIQFIQSFEISLNHKIGIITFERQERDYLRNKLSQRCNEILIGTVSEWTGIEREIVFISFSGHPENVSVKDINIAITRGQSYLFLFGDYDIWSQHSALMRSFLSHPQLHIERTVVLS